MNSLLLFQLTALPLEGQIVTALIFLLLVVAVGRTLWAYLSLRAERSILQEIAWRAERYTDLEAARADLASSGASHVSGTITRRTLLDALEQGAIRSELMNFDQRIYWPRLLAGLFVFIGLIGTVWGISTAVSSLGASVASINSASLLNDGATGDTLERWSELLRGIDTLLAGMKTAFVCTLWGLLATVVASIANGIYLTASQKLENEITDLANNYLLPLRERELQRREEEAQKRDLAVASTQLAESAQNLDKTAAMLATDAARLAASLTPAVSYLENVAAQAQRLIQQMEAAAQTVDASARQAQECLLISNTTLRDASETLTQIGQTIQASATALQNAVASLPDSQAIFAELSIGVSQAAMRMEQAVRDLREAFADTSRAQSDRLDRFVERVDAVRNDLRALLRQFEITLHDVSAASDVTPLRQQLEQLEMTLRSELQRMELSAREARATAPPASPTTASPGTTASVPAQTPLPPADWSPRQPARHLPDTPREPFFDPLSPPDSSPTAPRGFSSSRPETGLTPYLENRPEIVSPLQDEALGSSLRPQTEALPSPRAERQPELQPPQEPTQETSRAWPDLDQGALPLPDLAAPAASPASSEAPPVAEPGAETNFTVNLTAPFEAPAQERRSLWQKLVGWLSRLSHWFRRRGR